MLFDEFIDRSDTDSLKWGEGCGLAPDRRIPMWVADMDFACPGPIKDALIKRANHPIYGYARHTEDYKRCVAGWIKHRHGYEPEPDSLTFSPPGVLYAVYTMIRLMTAPGGKVVVMMPNYDPLHQAVSESGRVLVESELQITDGNVTVDFEDLEKKLADDAEMLIISHPHNPTGRVWKRQELEIISELCIGYGVYVISDEIHADFVSRSLGHIPFPSLSPEASQNCMACYSANKGFNLGGLQTGTLLIADKRIRRAFEKEMELGQTRLDTIFGIEATRAAYSHPDCEKWLDEAIIYVEENKRTVYRFLAENTPKIKAVPSEGTYLMLLDMSGLKLGSEGVASFFEEALVQVCLGSEFGSTTDECVRINLACPKSVLTEALGRIKKAYMEKER